MKGRSYCFLIHITADESAPQDLGCCCVGAGAYEGICNEVALERKVLDEIQSLGQALFPIVVCLFPSFSFDPVNEPLSFSRRLVRTV